MKAKYFCSTESNNRDHKTSRTTDMKHYFSATLLAMAILFTSCGGKDKAVSSLDGAGATFPLPYYNVIFKKYDAQKGVSVNYGAQGSGAGINSLKNRVVDFAGSDAFLSDEEMAEMPAVIHVPTCLGAVVLAYNVPEIKSLNLTGEIIADIYLGKITMWNDPRILAINPGTTLSDKKISPVYRSDGSGTTNVFSDYLSKVSEEWQQAVGTGKSLKWPVGMAAKGNPGVAGVVKQTNGAIGYIGSEYSFSLGMPTAAISNFSGQYILPTTESISAAAKGDLPEDTRTMITNSDNPEAYPISCLTWLILYQEQGYDNRSEGTARTTVELMKWVLSDEAQDETTKVHFAPVPEQMRRNALKAIDGITFNGQPISTEN